MDWSKSANIHRTCFTNKSYFLHKFYNLLRKKAKAIYITPILLLYVLLYYYCMYYIREKNYVMRNVYTGICFLIFN